jgi:predicted secreted hydrolase
MKLKFTFLLIAISITAASFAQDWKVYPYSPPGSKISFPKDEGRHSSEPIEWWYTSGHVTGVSSGKSYSFMLTYFYFPATVYDGFRILNITDDATGKFYEDTRPLNYTALSTTSLNIEAKLFEGGKERWTNARSSSGQIIPFQYTINAASADASFDFDVTSLKRPLILGDDGLLDQGANSYTYYYSQTNNAVSGTLTLNGVTEEVKGTSWIDRQYGNFNPMTGEDYEWFQVQLSNGMDFNLWNIFTLDRKIPNDPRYKIIAAYVNDETQFTSSDFQLERLAYTAMKDSARTYASKWKLTSAKNNIDLTISVKNNDNEIKWPFRFYEGATTISGTVDGKSVTGAGFAELLHSYENPSLTIKYPSGGIYKINEPIKWQLLNPDEGRRVTYDLEYSTNDKATFNSIATGLTDTFFLWKDAPVVNGDKIWFKITATSVDKKLKGVAISDVAATASSDNSEAIKIYPNPVTEFFQTDPPLNSGIQKVEVMDANGKIVKLITDISANKFHVAHLNPGVYFVRFLNGDKKTVIKFIKKR